MFFYIYLFPIALSAVASLRAFRQNWPRPYQYFSIFLWTVLFIELFACSWTLWLHAWFTPPYREYNNWIYNPFMIFEYLFYLCFYFIILKEHLFPKKILFLIGILFPAWGIINMIRVQGMVYLNTYSLIISSLLVVYLSTAYFISLLRNTSLVTLSKEPLVWISIGAFFYHLCCIPYFIFLNYTTGTNLNLIIMLSKIMSVLCWFMYSSYTIAFLCRKHFQP